MWFTKKNYSNFAVMFQRIIAQGVNSTLVTRGRGGVAALRGGRGANIDRSRGRGRTSYLGFFCFIFSKTIHHLGRFCKCLLCVLDFTTVLKQK